MVSFPRHYFISVVWLFCPLLFFFNLVKFPFVDKNKINAYAIWIDILLLQTRNFIWKIFYKKIQMIYKYKRYDNDNKVHTMKDILWIRNRKLSIVHIYVLLKTYKKKKKKISSTNTRFFAIRNRNKLQILYQ